MKTYISYRKQLIEYPLEELIYIADYDENRTLIRKILLRTDFWESRLQKLYEVTDWNDPFTAALIMSIDNSSIALIKAIQNDEDEIAKHLLKYRQADPSYHNAFALQLSLIKGDMWLLNAINQQMLLKIFNNEKSLSNIIDEISLQPYMLELFLEKDPREDTWNSTIYKEALMNIILNNNTDAMQVILRTVDFDEGTISDAMNIAWQLGKIGNMLFYLLVPYASKDTVIVYTKDSLKNNKLNYFASLLRHPYYISNIRRYADVIIAGIQNKKFVAHMADIIRDVVPSKGPILNDKIISDIIKATSSKYKDDIQEALEYRNIRANPSPKGISYFDQ